MPDKIVIRYRFSPGDRVSYNHGGETFTVNAQRHTRNPCTVDRLEYLLVSPAGQFWALERELTRRDGV
jgi:hypothetical protein